MYARKNQKLMPALMLLLGAGVLALRLLLDVYGTDQKGLLIPWHPIAIAIGLLGVIALVLAILGGLKIEDSQGYHQSFPKSILGFLGHLFAGVGILATVLTAGIRLRTSLDIAWTLLGFASLPCLLIAGWCRLRGIRPFFLLHLCPALFLMLQIISRYQGWSSDPQLMNYLFSLLGIISLLFFAFYHSAFDAGLEWRHRLTIVSLAAIFLNMAALPGCGYPWLYLGCLIWVLTDRPTPVPRRRRRRPALGTERTAE